MSKLALMQCDANDRMKATGNARPAKWERVDLRQGRTDSDMFAEPLSRIELRRGAPKHDKQGNVVDPGRISPTYANAVRILTEMGPWAYDEAIPHFRFNSRSQKIVCARDWPIIGPRGRENEAYCKDAPWDLDKGDTLEMAYYLSRITGADFTPAVAVAAIEYCALKSQFDPIADYLAAVRWDGKPRLRGMLASYFGADDNAWHSTAGRKWMISAVARTLKPGCKVDTALVFEGKQGIGKTSGIRALASPAWHAEDCPKLGSEESKRFLLGKWIVEIGELDALRKSDANAAKGFLSTQSDNIRKPYAPDYVDVPRRCVFAGTTNDQHYLSDVTGNRRFWPVRTSAGTVAVAALAADRDQLWAEAVSEYEAGEPWWLSADESAVQSDEADDRTHDAPLVDVVRGILDGYSPGAEVRVAAILERMEVRPEHMSKVSYAVTQALTRLGWSAVRLKRGGQVVRFWTNGRV